MRIINLLFSFQGRIPRLSFWVGLISIFGIFLAVGGIMNALAGEDGNSKYDSIVGSVLAPLCIWIALAIQIKRWHDRGHSGWRVLINVIPILGPLWVLVELGFLKGSAGANRFGADPLQTAAPVEIPARLA